MHSLLSSWEQWTTVMNSPHKLCGLNLLKRRKWKCRNKRKKKKGEVCISPSLTSYHLVVWNWTGTICKGKWFYMVMSNEQNQLPAVNNFIWNWLFLLLFEHLHSICRSFTERQMEDKMRGLLLFQCTAEVLHVFQLLSLLSGVAGSVAHFGSYSRKMSKYTAVRLGFFPPV